MIEVNHCQFRKGLFALVEMGEGADACHAIPPPGGSNLQGQTREAALAACHERCRASDACEGVNVVPARPPASLAFTAAAQQNVPWDEAACPAAAFANEPPGTSVCYGLIPAPRGLESTSEVYVIVDDDAQDEIYFSTCVRKVPLTGFDLLLPPSSPPPPQPAPWRVGDYCLSCEDTQSAPLTGYWQLAEECEMCWRENLTLAPDIPGGPTIVDAPSEDVSIGDGGGGISLPLVVGGGGGAAVVLLCVIAAVCVLVRRRCDARRDQRKTSFLTIKKPEIQLLAPPEVDDALPPGWSMGVDPASMQTYYYNAETGQTQWMKPVPSPHV